MTMKKKWYPLCHVCKYWPGKVYMYKDLGKGRNLHICLSEECLASARIMYNAVTYTEAMQQHRAEWEAL